MISLPTIRPGDPMRAEHITAIYAALESLQLRVAPPLSMSGGVVSLDHEDGAWYEVGDGDGQGNYDWTRVIPAANGKWTQTDDTGTAQDDPLVEINANANVQKSTYVWGWRDDATDTLLFQQGTC